MLGAAAWRGALCALVIAAVCAGGAGGSATPAPPQPTIDGCQQAIANMSAKAWDAWGKPGAGIAEGNLVAYGAYDECKSLEGYQYCLVQETGSGAYVLLGTCVPRACDAAVLPAVLRNLTLVRDIYELTHISLFGNSTVAACDTHVPLKPGAKAAFAFLGFLVGTVLICTLIDFVSSRLAQRDDGRSLNAEDRPLLVARKRQTLPSIVGVLSLFKGLDFVLGPVKGDTIPCLEGMRVLSMMWVVFGHTYYWSTVVPMANGIEVGNLYKDFAFQMILNAPVSVDTFFYLSGFLVCLGILKFLKTGARFPYFLFLIKRFLRIVPALAVAMLLFTQLLQYMGDGPLWTSISTVYDGCHSDWWSVLLFINNFYPNGDGNLCFAWAWYLAVDWDLFVIAPLFIIALHKNAKIGVGLLLLASVACFASVLAVGFTEDIGEFDTKGRYYNDYYIKPWARAQPYLVGIFTAFLYNMFKENKDRGGRWPLFSLPVRLCLHVVFIGAGFLVMFGTTGDVGAPGFATSGRTSDTVYLTFARFTWAAMLAWITLACVFGYLGPVRRFLSWKIWTPLSRLTYCAYLIHPIILYAYFWSLRNPVYFRQIEVIILFLGIMCLVYMSAFVFVMFVELPLGNLLGLVFPTPRPKDKKPEILPVPLKAPAASFSHQ